MPFFTWKMYKILSLFSVLTLQTLTTVIMACISLRWWWRWLNLPPLFKKHLGSMFCSLRSVAQGGVFRENRRHCSPRRSTIESWDRTPLTGVWKRTTVADAYSHGPLAKPFTGTAWQWGCLSHGQQPACLSSQLDTLPSRYIHQTFARPISVDRRLCHWQNAWREDCASHWSNRGLAYRSYHAYQSDFFPCSLRAFWNLFSPS